MKRSGFTLISTIVGMFIIGSILILIITFNNYTYNVINLSNQELEALQIINNKITELYNVVDWGSLNEENLVLKDNTLEIQYVYDSETEYSTERLKLNVIYLDDIKEYNLERSRHNRRGVEI